MASIPQENNNNKKSAEESAKVFERMLSIEEDRVAALKELTSLQRDFNKELQASEKFEEKLKGIQGERKFIEEELTDITKKVNRLRKNASAEELKALKEYEDLQKKLLVNRDKELAQQEALYAENGKLYKIEQKRKALADEALKGLEKNLDFIDDITAQIKKIPVVGDFLYKALGADKIKEKVTNKLKKVFLKDIGNNTGSAVGKLMGARMLVGVGLAIGAIAGMFALAFKADKATSEMARNMGVTKHEAHEVQAELEMAAATSNVLVNSGHAMIEAFEDLRTVIGSASMITSDMAEASVLLKTQFGLTGEEAAKFQVTSMAAGKSALEMAGQVENMTANYNQLTGDSISHSDVMKDIAKTSKTTAARYGGFGPSLIKATIQAKKLGMALEDTVAVADSLLSIEDSIANEVKAQVLLGKSFNMDRARSLALAGDTAAAAEEAISQLNMGYEEFTKMDVIKQRAAAEAAGLTVEQLTTALELEKVRQALGGAEVKTMRDLTEEQLKQLEASGAIDKTRAAQLAMENQSASAAEKFEQSMSRIKDVITAIVSGPLGTFIDGIANLANNTATMKGILITVGIILAGMAVSAIATMSAFTLGIGAIAIAAGIATATIAARSERTAAVNDAKQIQDGIINPSGGLVVSGPKGSIQLDPQDSIVAGTNLGGTGGGTNGSSMIAEKLDKLITMVSQPVVIKIGDKSIQELDSAISLRRNYTSRIGSTYGSTV